MSTPNEPQNPYGSGEPQQPQPPQDPSGAPQQPQQPSGAPQYPAAPSPAGTPQYPSAPQYPGAGGAPQYPGATPYGSAPAYQQPGAGYGYTYPKNSLAVWSLVLGIVSFVLSCGLFTGIPAVIVGNNAKKAVARGEANNGGMATAGIILGWIAIALSIIGIIFFAVLFANADFRDAFNESYTNSY